jgi:L-lactate dehydrogenase complex protein LldE
MSSRPGRASACSSPVLPTCFAFASLQLLERAGCDVSVPLKQTCCGQPAYNAGDFQATIPLAKNVVALLEDADYVVIPSGSCAGMISHHYPNLLEGEWRERAIAVAAKTFELTSFLTEVVTLEPGTGANIGQVAYHDSCAGLRELSIREQPRELLQSLCSAQVSELELRDVCCGFGGTFCAKMPQISSKMTDDKLKDVLDTGAPLLTGGDLGCLMTIAGRASRLGQDIEVRHVAELLAGNLDGPAIGEGD